MKIKKYSKDSIDEGCQISLHNCLYVRNWSFERWLSYPDSYKVKVIYILYDGEKPIGNCIVLDNSWDVNIGIFIKDDYRSKGFGKKLFRFVVKDNKQMNIRYSRGIRGSETFFKKSKEGFDNVTDLYNSF